MDFYPINPCLAEPASVAQWSVEELAFVESMARRTFPRRRFESVQLAVKNCQCFIPPEEGRDRLLESVANWLR